MAEDNKTDSNNIELAGKYLTFKLGKEEYGIEILKVIEIIGIMEITEIPRTPDFVKGVVNLRGVIHPVIDLRTKFSMQRVDFTDETCIIVVVIEYDGKKEQMGIIVDSVSEVLDIEVDEIEETPSLGSGIDTNFIKGMAKTKGSVKILLDVEKVLSTQEVAELAKVTTDAE